MIRLLLILLGMMFWITFGFIGIYEFWAIDSMVAFVNAVACIYIGVAVAFG